MAIGVPLDVCATASTPIALSLIVAGLSPGAALAFLISGPATNSAALITLWKVLGRRTTVVYLVTVAIGAVGIGLLVDGIIASGVVPASALIDTGRAAVTGHVHHATGGFGWWLRQVSAVALLLVVANALRPRTRETIEARPGEDTSTERPSVVEMRVKGMRCNGCVQSLTRALAGVAGVSDVVVRLEDGTARVTGRGMARDQLLEAVTSLGFEVTNPEVLVSG
jgi:copper chaperone CopZ